MKKLIFTIIIFVSFLIMKAQNNQSSSVNYTLGQEHLISTSPPEWYSPFTWGPWQFPSISRLPDGSIIDRFSTGFDAASDYGKVANYISKDGGESWINSKDTSLNHVGILLPNGDRLEPAVLPSIPISKLNLSAVKNSGQFGSTGLIFKFYDAYDLPPELSKYSFYRLKAGETKWKLESTNVKSNDVPRAVVEGVYSFAWLMNMKVAPDGSLFAVNYGLRQGKTERRFGGVVSKWRNSVVFYHSIDNGKSWSVYSDIPYQGNIKADSLADVRDGFTEPDFEFMADGSMICVMRTCDATNGPMYIARSADKGKTWSKPEYFSPFGVWPQLLKLKNGVVVLSYGRPGVNLLFCNDGKGKVWSKNLVLSPSDKTTGTGTCGYTGILATGDDKFIITHSKWPLKNDKGQDCKAIVVREITVY